MGKVCSSGSTVAAAPRRISLWSESRGDDPGHDLLGAHPFFVVRAGVTFEQLAIGPVVEESVNRVIHAFFGAVDNMYVRLMYERRRQFTCERQGDDRLPERKELTELPPE